MSFGMALLLSIVAASAYIARRIGGDPQLERPIILAPIVGLLLGDLQTGILVGGAFELIFIGAQAIGGAVPPNVVIATVLGTAFAITTGEGVSTAVLVGAPAAVVASSFELFAKGGCAFLVHWADRYAEEGNRRGITGVMWLGNSIHFLAYLVPTFLALYFGQEVVRTVTEALSGPVSDGLNVAAGLLPALGFGLLLSMLATRTLIPFFLIGFILTAYTEFTVIGVGLLGAAVIVFLQMRAGEASGEQSTEAAAESAAVGGRDLRSLFWRSLLLQSAFNYERFQNIGWWWGLKNLLRRWYPDEEDLKQADRRHLTFFNTHPWMVGIVYGLIVSLEARKAAGEDIDDEGIQGLKVGTMAPLAGIGDALFFGAIRPMLSGLTATLATGGLLVAPLIFIVSVNIVHLGTRWYGLKYAVNYGQAFLGQLGGDMFVRVRDTAVMVGLLVVGALTADFIPVTTPLAYTRGDASVSVQDSLDQILPNVIPLAVTLIVFALVRRRVSPTWILVALAVLGVVTGYFGILEAPAA